MCDGTISFALYLLVIKYCADKNIQPVYCPVGSSGSVCCFCRTSHFSHKVHYLIQRLMRRHKEGCSKVSLAVGQSSSEGRRAWYM